jgi:beta propeller repeat protein
MRTILTGCIIALVCGIASGGDGFRIYGVDLSTNQELVICPTETAQFPKVSGNVVVWQDDRNGDTDIYGYDMATQTEFPICTAVGIQNAVSISGDLVVWQDTRNGGSDIYGYDLASGQEIAIATNGHYQGYPVTNGDLVAWVDGRDNWAIYGQNIGGTGDFLISPGGVNVEWRQSLDMSGEVVVWRDWFDSGEPGDVGGVRTDQKLPTNEFRVTYGGYAEDSPAISGDIVVFEKSGLYAGPFSDIYGYDLASGTEFDIAVDWAEGLRQFAPDISGDIVVWVEVEELGGLGTDMDIQGYDLTTGSGFDICTEGSRQGNPSIDGNIVVWEDGRVPEPATLSLLAMGGVSLLRRKK